MYRLPHGELVALELVHALRSSVCFWVCCFVARWGQFGVGGIVIDSCEVFLRRFLGMGQRDWESFKISTLDVGHCVVHVVTCNGSSVKILLSI